MNIYYFNWFNWLVLEHKPVVDR